MPTQSRVTVEDFSVLHLIGKGGYGKVYLVRHKLTGRHYAMKVLRKASILLQRRQIGFTMTERTILSKVQHPFIVKLYYAFQSNSKLYLIMEYVAGGELFTHMANERIFSEDQATFYAAELVLAISHLHRLGIMFRDIKPENCLLNRNGHLVLTDFGLSKTALGGDGRASTFCGTPAYMAPEILNSSPSYDFSVDWWSLGVLIYEMLIGSVPFKGKAPMQVAKNIAKMKVNYPNYMTPDAKDLIRRLLRKTPAQRISYGAKGVENIKSHRFFRKIDWTRLEKDHESLIPPIIPAVSGDADVSNFAAEFTEEQLPPSLAFHGGMDEHESLPDAPPISTLPNRTSGHHAEADGEVDPATAFLGFSFVANSVMDTIRVPHSP
ncbi:Pkinase-domain-containing protein [Coemansia reversa NRRL 1564]|uniref:non-specific serine/threonine protein kinase n=1 Tax=Coemansia reversa (strain ATCC 12441 / NRRL 1564) TaxID=763665 RepID=A0A2G5BAT3_COERN|nr:Pkinase-domain-containing protein [Coemansia reversa NRRL 1564]|eukprot:PIA16126.1 Pkinase-domain-containing protein [Coemansia reversa NRRL 1564]